MVLGRKKGEQKRADVEYKDLKEEISFLKQRIHDLEQTEAGRNKEIGDLRKSLKENLTRYNELIDHSRSIILEWDTEGNIIFLNQWGLELFGFTMEELIGRNVVGTIVPEIDRSGANLVGKMEVVQKNPDEFYSSENENIKKNGESVWISWTNIGILDKDGKLVKTLSIGIDRTLQRQQEVALDQYRAELEAKVAEQTKELRDSEIAFRSTFEQAAVGIALVGTDGRWLRVNQKLCDILGYARDELLQRTFHDITHPEDVEADNESRLNLLEGQIETYQLEKRYIHKNGSIVWVELTVSMVRKPSGEPDYIISVTENVTIRKKVEQKLQESELRFRSLSENSLVGVYIVKEGRLFYVNSALEKTFGYLPGELTGADPLVVIHPDDHALVTENMRRRIAGEVESMQYEFRGRCKSGEMKYIEVRGSRAELDGQTMIIGNIIDITERTKAEMALQASESMLLESQEIAHLGSWALDVPAGMFKTSKIMDDLFGIDQSYDHSVAGWLAMIHPDDREMMADYLLNEVIERGRPCDKEFRIVHQNDRATRWLHALGKMEFDANGKPIILRGTSLDISERKLFEEKLQKSYESVKRTLDDAINAMVKIVELRDPYTAGHQHKVAHLATVIAKEMKLDAIRIDQLRAAAVIHDIGKMYVPSDILSKPGKLSGMELNLIKTHSQSGYDIVKSMEFPGSVAKTVQQHHERLDGSGYPNQLKGEDTLLEAKILAVADVVEAMASHRPYRPALGIDMALEEISNGRGKLYDPDVVDTCLKVFEEGFLFDYQDK